MGATIKENLGGEIIWLRDGARVDGNVSHGCLGNIGFLGNNAGAMVEDNVLVKAGQLWASGASTSNRVDGNIICLGGGPAFVGDGVGSAANWNGGSTGGILDGTIGGHYKCN